MFEHTIDIQEDYAGVPESHQLQHPTLNKLLQLHDMQIDYWIYKE
jgi:hypothetical protein